MKTTALIEKGKDGRYTIYTPDLQSTIIGTGDTVSEAKADFENTMKEVLETYEETGEAIPEELINTIFVRSLFFSGQPRRYFRRRLREYSS